MSPVTTYPCPGGGSVSSTSSKVLNQLEVNTLCRGVPATSLPGGLPTRRDPFGLGGTPGLPGLPGPTNTGFGSQGDFFRSIGRSGCTLLSGSLRALCESFFAGISGGTGSGGNGTGTGLTPGDCPDGRISIGGRCVSVGGVGPGGEPFTTGAGGEAVRGAFGLPALRPMEFVDESTRGGIRRKCARGFALGLDNLCYPKAVLPRRSKFRKWRPSVKPSISRKDERALASIEAVQKTLKALGKKAKLKVTNS